MSLLDYILPFPEPQPGALASKLLDPHTTEYTWEDHRALMRQRYPIRAFIHYDLTKFFRRASAKISNIFYWIRCHTYNRYHILKISDPNPVGWKWGYQDPVLTLAYAMFAILVDFVEHERPDLKEAPRPRLEAYEGEPEEWELESLRDWDWADQRIHALYRWWMLERPDIWYDHQHSEILNEKLHELVQVRDYLWT